jgi:hypothetical protein
MPDTMCRDDPSRLDALRRWAWERGRTDIVLDLDLHANAWGFAETPTRASLVRLAAALPAGEIDGLLEQQIHRVAGARGSDADTAPVQEALRRWSSALCLRVAADLNEMAADLADCQRGPTPTPMAVHDDQQSPSMEAAPRLATPTSPAGRPDQIERRRR